MIEEVNIKYFENLIKGKNICLIGPAGYLNENNIDFCKYDIIIRLNHDIKKKSDILFTNFYLGTEGYDDYGNLSFGENWFDGMKIFTLEDNDYIVNDFLEKNKLPLKDKNIKIFKVSKTGLLTDFHNEYSKYSKKSCAAAIKAVWFLLKMKPKKINMFGITFYNDAYLGQYDYYNKEYLEKDIIIDNCKKVEFTYINNAHSFESEFLFFYDLYILNKNIIVLDDYCDKLFTIAYEKINLNK